MRVLTIDSLSLALEYINETKLPWPLIRDSERELYRAYGMGRGSWWSLYGLPSIFAYLKLIFAGHRPGKPGKDWRQLGGVATPV